MPLIAAQELAERIGRGQAPTLLDVRWELASGAQRDRFLAGHIPGAVFVDLEHALADPPGAGGRHPLPDPDRFAGTMRAAGVSGDRPVVVYDAGNALAAARAWWLLRFHGHPGVRVLDGGLAAWVAAGGKLASGEQPSGQAAGDFTPAAGGAGAMAVLDAGGAGALAAGDGGGVLIDARAPERFRGDVEPMDPVAGHIPGARNVPMAALVRDDGRLRDPAALRAVFADAGVLVDAATEADAGVPAEADAGVPVDAATEADAGAEVGAGPIGAYCGSGITAAHTVLALSRAGLRGALYPGSWSEWVTDPDRPVATGD